MRALHAQSLSALQVKAHHLSAHSERTAAAVRALHAWSLGEIVSESSERRAFAKNLSALLGDPRRRARRHGWLF